MNLNEKLLKASKKGDTEEVELLLKKGADINAKDVNGKTALMWAAGYGPIEIAELLIEKGADVNARNEYGQTALMWATMYGHKKIVELLIQKGVDVFYAYKHNDARETINQLAGEKPELFTEEQKLMFEMYSNPENISLDRRKEVLKLLRKFQKKGSISKTESLELFTNLQEIWNENTNIKSKEMRKPEKKPDKNKIRKAIQ
ncbi:ankyrin repeat domain-containing protein [Candidatus Micrarchaeota archaeon]|nr:ankyrin repeat domain-containing protein [Candidatus Micrarchaeota archaeon]